MQQPFENAKVLLDFLEADEPERYVFRGQTRSYEGPMLTSVARDRFTPFESLTERSKWAGITTFQSVLKREIHSRWLATNPTFKGVAVDDGKSTWDLPEAVYQKGFGEYFNQPHRQRIKEMSNVLREGTVPGIMRFLGNSLGSLLCQQYGFTSTALDVTTDPSVAMFFAMHQSPFYTLVTDSPDLGIIYRWPKERAMIAQDLLLPLEGSNFQSIVTSFENFIKGSVDLNIFKDSLLEFKSAAGGLERFMSTAGVVERRQMIILAKGENRSFDVLRFPPGTFNRSRIGRQHAALLWPEFEVVKPLAEGRDSDDNAALLGDLLKTHQGEFFYFRHAPNVALSSHLNKFDLWPSVRPPSDCPTPYSRVELEHDRFEFEDLYLEMMLRFFSSCSPFNIVVEELLEPTERQPRAINLIGGVVDLGYLLQPSDARLMAERLRTLETYTPIPTLRYIPEDQAKSFQTAFADALGS